MQESKLQISFYNISLEMDKKNLRFSILKDKTEWKTEGCFSPHFVLNKKFVSLRGQQPEALERKEQEEENRIYFHEAKEQKHELVESGVGEGIYSSYSGFSLPNF